MLVLLHVLILIALPRW